MTGPSGRAAELIRTLDLVPHPEGGFYRETFRSPRRVRTSEGHDRSALTVIDFLLVDHEHSRWHRVPEDELWTFHEGAPIELFVLTPDLQTLERSRLADSTHESAAGAPRSRSTLVVPAGHWQAARCTSDYTLAGCAMGPGFEFEGFTLLADHPDDAAQLRARHPELASML